MAACRYRFLLRIYHDNAYSSPSDNRINVYCGSVTEANGINLYPLYSGGVFGGRWMWDTLTVSSQ